MKQEEERHSLLMNLVLTPERRVRPNTSLVLVSILLLYFSLSVSMHQNFETLQGLNFFSLRNELCFGLSLCGDFWLQHFFYLYRFQQYGK